MVIGIDEVGRGCWAGPLVVGAVAFDDEAHTSDYIDSKQLSAQKRERLDALIRETAVFTLGWVSPAEVDELGLTSSVRLAIQRALNDMSSIKPSEIIIDGSYNFLPEVPNVRTIIKADAKIPAVSAASILAKVARDNYMKKAAYQYPEYGFETNVGYGTARHRAALEKHGVTSIHRRSFAPIKAIMGCSTLGYAST